MNTVLEIKQSLLHLVFPHICAGCGNDRLPANSQLCLHCLADLPETGFEALAGNPIEKKFWGRIPLEAAAAGFYFSAESRMQELMHQFKYKGNKILGRQLGRLMGERLREGKRFDIDALVPLPLFARKEKKRGFNQAQVLCEGMAEAMKLPVYDKLVFRTQHTETQTRKGRIERWQNMEGRFSVQDSRRAEGKHLLLVDDVVTTGATLEACGEALLKIPGCRLSIATLCYATR